MVRESLAAMNDPFSPTYCVRCKRPNSDGAGLCEECRRSAPAALTPLQPVAARWSPIRGFLLFRNPSLRGEGGELARRERITPSLPPFGLVAADLWQDENRYTLYGYAAAGYHLFFGLVACIQYREAADPLHHNLMYILEATLGGALLLTLWIYRTTKRAYYES